MAKHLAKTEQARKTRRRGGRHAGWLLAAALLLFLSSVTLGLGVFLGARDGEAPQSVKSQLKSLAQSSEAGQLAQGLKEDYFLLLDDLKAQDFDAAREHRAAIDRDVASLEDYLDSPVLKAAAGLTSFDDELALARDYLDLAKTANTTLLDPLLDYAQAHPFSDFKAEGGVRVSVLLGYLDLAEELYPAARSLAARVETTDLSLLSAFDSEGRLVSLAEQAPALVEKAAPLMEQLPLLRAMLGAEGDRLYLFAAQNTAEVRASGGFPGAIGKLRITDGVLRLEDFESCYDVLQQRTPWEAHISAEENELFAGRMYLSWDSDFCPDFERAASIWAMSYRARSGERADGVVSATPVIIQRLLSFLGTVTLDDGTVLDGDNAMRTLGHDLYFRYFPARSGWSSNSVVDALFSQTASRTLDLLISTAGFGHLGDYLRFARESFGDRTLLLWMDDPAEEDALRALGWSGGLNRDPAQPKLGVFFNSDAASKMGWFLELDAAIGEPRQNADGSQTYPVVVTFTNTLTPEERDAAGSYILGSGNGGLSGILYVFAPAGGSIDTYDAGGKPLYKRSYEGLELVYQSGVIPMGGSVVISCEVTVSPLAQTPLGVLQTPTAQAYH